MRRPRSTSQASLPGFTAPPRTRDDTPVAIPLLEVGKGTADAWFLAPLGGGSPKWAARRLVRRGDGPQASQFTMPRWLAIENGWLR